MEIRIENLEELQGKLSKLITRNDVEKACAQVERLAKQKAPKDTGALARSITYEVTETTGEIVGNIYTPIEYAPYVEYGTGLFAEEGGRQSPWSYKDDQGDWHTTSGQAPQPFMRPALTESKEKIIEILKEGIRNK